MDVAAAWAGAFMMGRMNGVNSVDAAGVLGSERGAHHAGISSAAIADLAISASRSTSSGAVPYSSWTIAVVVSTPAARGVTAVIALPRPARHGVPAGSP